MNKEREPNPTNKFIYILDTKQVYLRDRCRNVPLTYSGQDIEYDWMSEQAKPFIDQYLQFVKDDLSLINYSDSRLQSEIPHEEKVSLFNSLKGDKGAEKIDYYKCRNTVRPHLQQRVQTNLLSADALSFGVGIVRLKEVNNLLPISESEKEVFRNQYIIVPSNQDGKSKGKVYESTNILYGDTLGELEQLSERRNEEDLMNKASQSLQIYNNFLAEEGDLAEKTPINYRRLYKAHYNFGHLWDNPPTTTEELILRIDTILSKTIVSNTGC